jgi:hypothetical protein
MKRKNPDNDDSAQSIQEDTTQEGTEPVYYIIEKILKTRIFNGKKYMLIKWLGYSHEWNTWEPEENLRNEECDSSDEVAINMQSSPTPSTKKSKVKRQSKKLSPKHIELKELTPKKKPIIVSHKMSSKKLKAIMDRLNLVKKTSIETELETSNPISIRRDTN